MNTLIGPTNLSAAENHLPVGMAGMPILQLPSNKRSSPKARSPYLSRSLQRVSCFTAADFPRSRCRALSNGAPGDWNRKARFAITCAGEALLTLSRPDDAGHTAVQVGPFRPTGRAMPSAG